jgi:hypothetical protein
MAEDPSIPEPTTDQTIERGLLQHLADVGAALTPVALVAQPIISGLMDRPPKPEPPKVELPLGVDGD